MNKLDRVYKKDENVITRLVGDKVILVPIKFSSADLDCIYNLANISAKRIWQLIDGKRTVGKIKNIVLREFDVSSEEAEKGILTLLLQLKKINAIFEIK